MSDELLSNAQRVILAATVRLSRLVWLVEALLQPPEIALSIMNLRLHG